MTMSVFSFLRLVSVCGAALMGSSCLPMFGAGQVLAGSSLAEGLLPSSSLDLVWRGDIRSFPSSGISTVRTTWSEYWLSRMVIFLCPSRYWIFPTPL